VSTGFDVIGHGGVLGRLVTAAEQGKLTHALLLTGPDQVGKTTTALALAVELLDSASWPGGPLAHPDLWLEDADGQYISIERLRLGGKEGPTLQDFLSLRPYAGGRRVAVMGRADRLTEQAADSLLKTVEEPPPDSHLVLCAAHPERLPQTILSRCELVAFAPVPAAEISEWLVGRGAEPATAATAAALAAGRPGRAAKLAGESGALAAELESLNTFVATGGGGTAGALETAGRFTFAQNWEGRERALTVLATWASFVRDAACFAAGTPELAVWALYRPALEKWAENLPAERIVAILGAIVSASDAISVNAQPRLTFEALLLDIFSGPESPPPVDGLPEVEPVVSASGAAAPRRPRQAAPSARSKAAG